MTKLTKSLNILCQGSTSFHQVCQNLKFAVTTKSTEIFAVKSSAF